MEINFDEMKYMFWVKQFLWLIGTINDWYLRNTKEGKKEVIKRLHWIFWEINWEKINVFLRQESTDDPTNIGEWGTEDWLRWWTSLLCFRFLTELLERFPNSRSQIFLDLAFYYRFLATLYEGLYWHSQMNFDSIYVEKMLQIM